MGNNCHFCTRSLTFVPAWLRRSIGHSLVERLMNAHAGAGFHLGASMLDNR
jgi:hypothetical protein